jgi:hypothetical protein
MGVTVNKLLKLNLGPYSLKGMAVSFAIWAPIGAMISLP